MKVIPEFETPVNHYKNMDLLKLSTTVDQMLTRQVSTSRDASYLLIYCFRQTVTSRKLNYACECMINRVLQREMFVIVV